MTKEPRPSPTGAGFLHKKYRGFSNTAEVARAAQKHEQHTGEELKPQQPEARIQAYLDRLKSILEPSGRKGSAAEQVSAEQRKQRNIALLKRALYRQVVITPDQVPNSYFASVSERQRREGRPVYFDDDDQPHYDIPDEQRTELIEALIEDQHNSLDLWVDYLTSPDAKYPDELKYWAFRSMLGMSTYDKEQQRFGKRTKGTINPFPELNQEALALALGAVEKHHNNENITEDIGHGLEADQMHAFKEAVRQENFPKLYAWLIEQFKPIAKELLETTEGKWKPYPVGSEPDELVTSLKDYGTGWCIRGTATARRYLQGDQHGPGNDLLVFYSNNEQGQPAIPRCVIVMRDGIISEVRGIAPQENTDSHIAPVVKEKLKEIPDGVRYLKRTDDMLQLSTIEDKVTTGEALDRVDLIFLYEIDSPIEWFGYGKDSRIKTIRRERNVQADMLTIFDCTEAEIARNQGEVNESTKAYVGPLYDGIFKQLAHLENIYTQFPEKKIRSLEYAVGGMDAERLISAIEDTPEAPGAERKMQISPYSGSMLRNETEFIPTTESKQMRFVRLTVADLGFPNGATFQQIIDKALELGLEYCPPDAGPHLRLHLTNQPMNEWLTMGMEPITGSDRYPSVFDVERNDDGAWLNYDWARPGHPWFADDTFVFRSPQVES